MSSILDLLPRPSRLARHGCIVVLASVLCGCPPVAGPRQYSLIPLPVLGSTYTAGEGLSQNGQVVGASYDENDAATGFQRSAGLASLGGNEERPQSYAFSVNNDGVAVGYITGVEVTKQPARWVNGALEVLPTLGGDRGEATGINDCGDIVGSSRRADNVSRPSLWNAAGGVQELTAINLGGASASAADVTCTGFVTGSASTNADTRRAYRYDLDDGRLVDLGTLGGPNSFGNAVSEAGAVVGLSDTANDEFHPFLWTPSKGMVDLFASGNLGSPYGAAYDVNSSGEVVGYAEIDDDYNSHAFVWTEDEGMLDLNDLIPADSGWELLGASAINDAGQIAGWGKFLGQPVGFLLTRSCEGGETPAP